MNIEDAFFEYPYAEFRSDFEEEFTDIVKRKRKVYMTSIGLIGLGIAFLLTFLLTLAAGLLVLALVLMISGSMIVKSTNKSDEHRLEITASSTEMELVYLTNSRYFKRIFTADLNDIVSASFVSNRYDRIQIRFRRSETTRLRSFDPKHKEIPNAIENILEIDLVPDSLEQGFFLYFAPFLFKFENYSERKIEKKFGTKEDYFEKIGVEI